MIVARLNLETLKFCYRSIDITSEDIHLIRCGEDIEPRMTYLTDWERDFLFRGIIPKSKMTSDEYLKGFNYDAFSVHQAKLRYYTKKP